MARAANRIMTTHVGSLPRPRDLLDMMKYRLTGAGEAVSDDAFDARVTSVVAECVQRQVDCGLDFVTDGETSKVGVWSWRRRHFYKFGRVGPKNFKRSCGTVKSVSFVLSGNLGA